MLRLVVGESVELSKEEIAANKKRAFEYFEDLHNYFYHFRKSREVRNGLIVYTSGFVRSETVKI